MQQKHLVYVLLDGLGDLPVKLFKGKTPLEAARHPFMNMLVKKSKTGVVYSVGKGIAPESDVAVISMLGYDPFKTYTGRGPIEVFGAGMNMENGDLAVRCNFATVDERMNILDRRCGRSLTTEEATVLAKDVNRGVKLESHPAKFELRSTVGHRAVLLIKPKGTKLSGNITNTDPAYQRMEGLGVALTEFKNRIINCEPLDKTPEARRAADLLEEFTVKSNIVLKRHPINERRVSVGKPPANAVLSRDAGSSLPKFKPVKEQYGLEFASMVEMPVERGIALLCGMDLVELPKPSGDLRTDYKKRAEMACELAEVYDVVYIHIKGPDEPAHDGDCEAKKKAIELIDANFFKNLKVDLENVAVAVTADHSTPCTLRSHSDDPVPFMVSGCGIMSDGARVFSERECSNGSLGVMNGQQLLRRIFSLL